MAGKKAKASKKSRNPLQVGNPVLIRTVTFIYTGRIVGLDAREIVLEDAAWVADTGRFNEAVSKGTNVLNEVEPYVGDVAVGRGSIVDATLWIGPLPRDVK